MQQETEYLRELQEVGISEALLVGLEKGDYSAYVKFAKITKTAAERYKGTYTDLHDEVLLADSAPTSEESLIPLISEGKLPFVITALFHELIHDQQSIGPIKSALHHELLPTDLDKRYRDRYLREMQAYHAQNMTPWGFDYSPLDKLRKHPPGLVVKVGTFDINNNRDFNRLFKLFCALSAFGVSNPELSYLVKKEQLSNTRGSVYEFLERKLLEKRKEWGIEDNEDDYKITVEALLAKQECEILLARHQAQNIATEVLMVEAGVKGFVKPTS